jgi:gliding motility-associated-like protein
MMFKKVIITFLTIFLTSFVIGQQITVRSVATGTYGAGSTIGIPIKIGGCFALDNRFEMYLSDETGSFSSATKIGTYYGFFTPFVNGVIPNTITAGSNYKIRISSTNPVSSVDFGGITIANTAAQPVVNPTSSASNTVNDSTFGKCLITTSQNMALQEALPAGYTLSAEVLDSSGSNVSVTVSSNQLQFAMVPGNYYSVNLKIQNTSDNTISTKSFLVLASSNNLSLQTSGANDVCLPDYKIYTINVTGNGGIKNNYPGDRYSIDWGDGVIDTYTHCELITRNGELRHTYSATSCGRPPIVELGQNNAFRVGVSASNPFCSSGFTALTTYAKAWEKPIADFINPGFGCINTPIVFPNTSTAGLSGYNNAVNCTDHAVYEWWVDGKLVFNAPKDLVYTFTTLGTHTVRLVAINDPCSDEITKTITIRDFIGLNFTANGGDSLGGCVPLVVTLHNTSTMPAGLNWSDVKWNWQVYKRNSVTLADKNVDYIYVSGDSSSSDPRIKFLKPGRYFVRLNVSDYSCAHVKDVVVTVIDSANITLPFTTKRYCGLQTLDFGVDPNKISYSSNVGTETYSWNISGGSYSFVGGTTSSSPYPQIKFNDFATYFITVTFSNGCGTYTTPLEISFDKSIAANAGKDTAICGNTSASPIQLGATTTGPYSSYGWSIINGTGSLSDPNILNPVYTFGAGDSLSVTLRFTLNPLPGSACSSVSDDMVIGISANNGITSADSLSICSGSNVNYTPAATINGSSFIWTSSVVSGSVTGNSASGSGLINDVLVNTSSNADAIVKYTITPVISGCNGKATDVFVTVTPKPAFNITANPDSTCNRSNTNIKLTSSYTGIYYSWTATGSSPNVSGYANQNTPIKTDSIIQQLTNSGTQFETVTYTVTSYGLGGQCAGETKTITIVVRPDVITANAGPDQLLCSQSTTTLSGNSFSQGMGTWIQAGGPATTIVNPNSYKTTVNNLQPNSTYTYVWKLQSGNCSYSTDTVVVINRGGPVNINAGPDISVCNFNGVKDSVYLKATAPANSFEIGTWTLVLPKPLGSKPVITDSSKPNTSFIFDKAGTYKLVWNITSDAGCTPAGDTMLVQVFNLPVADSISTSDTSVCKGGNATVTAGANVGNIKKWQYSRAPFYNNVWVDTLTNANFINFNNLQDSIKVRVIVESAGALVGCTQTDTSNELVIHVAPTSFGGKTSGNDSVCNGNNGGTITLTGNVGKIVRWQSSTDNGTNWNTIKDSTNAIKYLNLSKTTWFRAVVQSGGCGVAYSDTTVIAVANQVTQALVSLDKIICDNNVVLEANAPGVGEVGRWRQITGPNTAVLSSSTNPVVTASGLIQGTYKFEWELSNGGCPPTKDTLTILIPPPASKAVAGGDVVVCNLVSLGTVTLNADPITRSYELGEWTIITKPRFSKVVFSNSADPNSIFSFNSPGLYQLQWKITNPAGCSASYDTVNINVYEKPAAGIIAADTSICLGSNVTVTMGAYVGNIKKWQYNPAPISDGIWRDMPVTSSSITFNSITDTFAVRAIVESKGIPAGCFATDTSNVLVINAVPLTVGGVTTSPATVCASANSGVIKLTGNVGRVLRWEYSYNNGSNWDVINNTTDSLVYNNLIATTLYRAVVESGNCGIENSEPTLITVLDIITQANAGPDQLLCNDTQTTLLGNSPKANEQGIWSLISGKPVVFSANNIPTPTISNLQPGSYTLVYSISNGGCPPKTDTVVVTVDSALVNIIDTTTKTICSGQAVTVGGQVATGGNGTYKYQWQQSLDATNWVDILGENGLGLTFIPPSDIYVRRVVTSLPCTDAGFNAYIKVSAPITNNTIGSDQSICINLPAANLIGSAPSGSNGVFTYQWQQSVDSGTTWVNITNATAKDYNPGVVMTSTMFRRNVSSIFCTGPQSSTSNVVTITINPNAKAFFTVTKDTSCPAFNIDSTVIKNVPFPAGNGAYQWFANGSLIGTGATFPGYVMNTSSDSVLIKLIVTSQFGCKDDSMQHMFYTRLKPVPAFTVNNAEGCGPLTVTVTNNTPNASLFTYKWDFGNGQTSVAANPGSIVFAANPNYGDTTYRISLTAYSVCDAVIVNKDILVHSKVKASFSPDQTFGCSPLPVTFANSSKGAIDFTWDFGDGTVVNTTSAQSMKHTYSTRVQDTFSVKLIARSVCGVDTQRYAIVVSPNIIDLQVSINGTDKFGCSPHAVKIFNNTVGAASYRWDFGDGNVLTTTRSNDTLLHTFDKPGVYNIKVLASNNCFDTTGYLTITALTTPKVDFLSNNSSTCINSAIQFSNLSDTITGALWNFGDGTTSNLTNPSHKYANPGTYIVSLQGIRQYASGNVCMDSAANKIVVVGSLPGNFTVTDSVSSCVPFTVTFKNNSVPSALTSWDFGDGKKDTGDVVTHTYVMPGKFVATMSAASAGGCKFVATKNIVVNGPSGTWQYDNGVLCGSTQIKFQVTATGADSLKYIFGDGTSTVTTNRIVYHTYAQPGTYVPTLQLFGGLTCRSTLTGVDTIKIDDVKAGFRTALVKECGQTKVIFTDTSSAFFGLQSWNYSFGDGQTANVKNPQHSYTSANNYQVKLIVKGTLGCSDTVFQNINVPVSSLPVVSIMADTAACVATTVSYTSNIVSKDPIGFMSWSFSNGATSSNASYTNRFGAAGKQSATLVVTTVDGCSDTAFKQIQIYPAPFVTAVEDKTICRGQSVKLDVTGASNYQWSPAINLSCSTCSNPVASPVFNTTYEVSATNSFGCIGRDTVKITVAQPFKMIVDRADTICKGGSVQLSAQGAEMYRWSPGATLNKTDIAAPIASPFVSTTYKVVGYDSAGCFTDTAYVSIAVGNVPTIDLGPDRVLSAGTLFQLNSTVTNGPIVKWDWKPYNDLSCTNCANPYANIKRDIMYTVKGTNAYGCTAADSIRIKVFCESTQVYIPNVFTPDGDGINDKLVVRGTGIKTIKLFRVFNRWGELVFEKANFTPNETSNGWDGTVRGVKAPPDVYVYTCEVLCENDNSYVYKGNVAIIK